MSGRVVLSLAIHNHQPVGNFPDVFEAAYRQAYRPMLEALERHRGIRLALHYSGPLLDWLDDTHPEFFPRVCALVEGGQIELMTGGYYEPILANIPDRDKDGQIRKLTGYLARRCGARPAGLWLAERVWEPYLPKPLAAAGVEYTIVDDTHFLAAGMPEEVLTGYFVTEEEGATLKIFPSRKRLRYLIPWQSPDEVLGYLRTFLSPDPRSRIPDPVLVMGDDGEKFGLWPGTHALCWEQGWVESFFRAVESAGDWLVTMPPGEAAALPAAGRVYLPAASYEEMLEWSGGFWRQFLVKYPEINTMHKRMLRVSRKVHAMRPGPRARQALDDLWAGQCNCPYWHGVFGGIYLPHIRRATFAHLIAAEAQADAGRRPTTEVADLDGDGADEVELASPAMVVVVDPADGGGVVEWDWRAERINLVNILSRRPESYHRQLLERGTGEPSSGVVETIHTTRVRVKEPGLDRLLVYDRYRRAGFLEHVLDPQATPDAFARGEVVDREGAAASPYRAKVLHTRDAVAVTLRPDSGTAGERQTAPLITKRLTVGARTPRLTAAFLVENPGESALDIRFGVETVWAITDPSAPVAIDGQTAPARETRQVQNAGRIVLSDWGWKRVVTVTFPEAEVWLHPLETVSNSEAGFERIVQGLVCLCVWAARVAPQGSWQVKLHCDLE